MCVSEMYCKSPVLIYEGVSKINLNTDTDKPAVKIQLSTIQLFTSLARLQLYKQFTNMTSMALIVAALYVVPNELIRTDYPTP